MGEKMKGWMEGEIEGWVDGGKIDRGRGKGGGTKR